MGIYIGKGKTLVSEINITPFVDVMLVLLIIFMVTVPMMTEGLEVELPKTQAVEVLPTDTDNIVLTIRKDGELFLDEYPVEIQLLEAQLHATVTLQGKQLFLQADKDVPYGIVVDVMGKVRSAGIENMGIVAERTDSSSTNSAQAPSATSSQHSLHIPSAGNTSIVKDS